MYGEETKYSGVVNLPRQERFARLEDLGENVDCEGWREMWSVSLDEAVILGCKLVMFGLK